VGKPRIHANIIIIVKKITSTTSDHEPDNHVGVLLFRVLWVGFLKKVNLLVEGHVHVATHIDLQGAAFRLKVQLGALTLVQLDGGRQNFAANFQGKVGTPLHENLRAHGIQGIMAVLEHAHEGIKIDNKIRGGQ
jgi:hypothetical protein